MPWLTYPAIRFLDTLIRGRCLFEYGSGTSTPWYAERCARVVSVENDPNWVELVRTSLESFENAKLLHLEAETKFIESIGSIGERFNAIVIDSRPCFSASNQVKSRPTDLHRTACLVHSLAYAEADCVFVIDNTDVNRSLDEEIGRQFDKNQIYRFPGWIPGNLHPGETTVIVRK